MKRTYGAWIALMMGILGFQLSGCQEKGVKFNVRYDQIQGLGNGDPVVFENNIAGRVLGYKYTKEGDYLVEVNVTPEFKEAATTATRFFIVEHPDLPDRKAIEMICPDRGAPLIASGQTVSGAAAASSFLARFLGNLEKNLGNLANEPTTDPKAEPLKSMAGRFTALLKELEKAGADVNESLERELIPRIREELEKLKGRLDTIGGEGRRIEEDIKNAREWMEKTLEEKFKAIKERFDQLAGQIQGIPAGESLKQLETAISGLLDELAVSGEELKQRFRKELLPLIEKELQELRERIEKTRPGEDLAPIRTQLERIRNI